MKAIARTGVSSTSLVSITDASGQLYSVAPTPPPAKLADRLGATTLYGPEDPASRQSRSTFGYSQKSRPFVLSR